MLPGIFINRDGTVELWKVTKYEQVSMKAYVEALASAVKMPNGERIAKAFVGPKKSASQIKIRHVLKKLL